MQRRDYFERMIEQVATAVSRAIGLASAGELEQAEAQVNDAWCEGARFARADAHRFDDATLRMLLGPRASVVASLFEAEAVIADARGEAATAERLRARAASLRQ